MSLTTMGTELLLILVLILANGIFAMSEIAVVSSRKGRLQSRAEKGDAGARRALELANYPNRFLSTIQIGITLVGIFAGAYGGATIATQLANAFEEIPAIARYSSQIALAVVIAGITYLTLILGELVPKRIALIHPERIAAAVARPMHYLSIAATPLVRLLSLSTDGVLRILGVRPSTEPPITEEEIAALIEQGTEAGVFEEEEQELVERVFWLGDLRAYSIMTPRHRTIWLDLGDPPDVSREKMVLHRHTCYPVCEGALDNVVGIVDVKDLWARDLSVEETDLRAALRQPLYIPDSMRALRLLELFRESGIRFALVVDEYGGIEGVVTLNDVLEEISGDLVLPGEPRVVQRDDGSWLIDASLSMDDLWDILGLEDRRREKRRGYHTIGGFVVTRLGHIPIAGESFDANGLRFEVVDMDGYRVDKVLVRPTPETMPGAQPPHPPRPSLPGPPPH